ncbi:tetraspanin-15-like isoform X2 [Petromyzon marinus]|uniref:Tetraspanin-15-like isoform X3 n=1 Tax=Petromyzon marinus TaxID=7757 RepID=A0AAJ7SUV6_PETMA|nr:tetraspanin-15-like isoform X3 [Petromyzon marinus]
MATGNDGNPSASQRCCDAFTYKCLKYALFAYAVIFWLLGVLLLCLGAYAEVERQRSRTMSGMFLAPAIILLLAGSVLFVVSFLGLLGALRDNLTLLKIFLVTMILGLIIELIGGIVALVFRNSTQGFINDNIRKGIENYYDDLDFKNIMDSVQRKGSQPVKNTQCGFGALKLERLQLRGQIYTRGCVDALLIWLIDHYTVMAAILMGFLLPQLVGIILSWCYIGRLEDIILQNEQQEQEEARDAFIDEAEA